MEVIIVEIQLDRDTDKRYSWPTYMTGLRARLRCRATLLVVTVDDSITAWCRKPIPLDRSGDSVIRPVVLGPRELPRITDFAVARTLPELAILSAASHGEDQDAAEIAGAALGACQGLDSDRSTRYADFIIASLGEAARCALERLMELHNYEFQSEFAKRYVKEGMKEGMKVHGRKVLLTLLAQRFGDPSEQIRKRIEQAEINELERWTNRVIPARTLEDVFQDK
ncbi:MAG: hypothetical protein MJE77_46580 [Proteobacteria bacterium]|nr:hypothetical protein [Pseudomonadota bacterium]